MPLSNDPGTEESTERKGLGLGGRVGKGAVLEGKTDCKDSPTVKQ